MANNFVDQSGLTLQTLNDLIESLENQFRDIYGSDINLEPQSPDAQMINIFGQAVEDVKEVVRDVYNSFSPSVATGRALDSRVAINGIQRQGATPTITPVSVTVDQNVTLQGLDSAGGNPFTVQDDTENNFQLQEQIDLLPGTHSLLFKAEEDGKIEVTLNTIQTIVTLQAGVVSVDNPDSPITIGVDEETDQQLRLRQQRSVALPSQGYIDGLDGALLAIDDVIDAKVYENDQDQTDVNGIPAHSIWCIVDGGEAQTIGETIRLKKTAGCGTKGDEEVQILEQNGLTTIIRFDRPELENLFIQMTITSLDPQYTPDGTTVAQYIFDNIIYKIGDPADISELTCIVKEFNPNIVVQGAGLGIDAYGSDEFIYPTTLDSRFILNVANMDITVV